MTFFSIPRRAVSRLASVRQFALLVVALGTVAAGAQVSSRPVTPSTMDASRSELTRLLDSLVRDSAYGKPKDRDARRNAIQEVRERLTDGDFTSGDRFLLDFGDPTRRADTVVVRDSANIALFNWPSASLHGVLRSELQATVEKYVGTYLREPRLRVYPLTRLSFVGGVGRPGVYSVDPARPLSDAIAQAGGTGQVGKPDKISVYRGDSRILSEKRVAEAIRDGSTVEELGLLSGDQIRVAQQKNSGGLGFRYQYQTILIAVSVLTALVAFIRASYVP